MLAATVIGPGYSMMQPPRIAVLGSTPYLLGEVSPEKPKSILPGVLSLVAGTVLVGGLLWGIKNF